MLTPFGAGGKGELKGLASEPRSWPDTMMTRKTIAILQGHPDATGGHLCHALADAYRQGAEAAGHRVALIDMAELELPFISSAEDWVSGPVPEAARSAQRAITAAEHLVIIYPLWLGTMPAVVKNFFEQVARPGFALEWGEGSKIGKKLLSGRSARIVITMGMPVFAYRWWYRAHSLKTLERNILGFIGINPIRETLFGGVGAPDKPVYGKWIAKMEKLGRSGS